jgi:predicted dehydrogenase
MIRCDTHAYWYGPFLFRCDPMRLRDTNPVCHHFFTSMYYPSRWEIPTLSGLKLAKVFDSNRAVAESFASTFPDTPQVYDDIEQMAADGGIDAAFIANCDLDAADHLELARPFLLRGIPKFIDKPFDATWKDA